MTSNQWDENKNGNEWIVANQQGSYAAGTPGRKPSRKYHCLLISRVAYYDDPHAVVAEVNEVVTVGDVDHALGAFRYDNTTHPRGFEYQTDFHADPEPTWTYRIGAVQIQRQLRLHPTRNVARLIYRFSGVTEPIRLRLFPYLNCRNVHSLHRENSTIDRSIAQNGPFVTTRPYEGFPELFFQLDPPGLFQGDAFWNRNVHYLQEYARGYDYREDLYCPGHFQIDQTDDGEICLTFGFIGELNHDGSLDKAPAAAKTLRNRLHRAAAAFLIRRGDGDRSILAGYPWFGECTRDALIALPGLTLARGKPAAAVNVLDTFAKHLLRGLLPLALGRDRHHDTEFSVDGTLLFIHAVQQVAAVEGEAIFARYAEPVLTILRTFLDHGAIAVHVRPEGLLYASSKPRPLTWMDATIAGEPVTPRSPYAVELNALFFNAMQVGLHLLQKGEDPDLAQRLQRRVRNFATHFNAVFWNDDLGYLADSHSGQVQNMSLRPNQLFALALPYRVITVEQGGSVLAVVREHLLTPRGLRSLAPQDHRYVGHYGGGPVSRDRAYHQGCVWPWLFGPYVDAVRNIEGDRAALTEIDRILTDMTPHLDEAGIGFVSELFDGDAPHQPGGSPAQACSVAELLRLDSLATQLRQKTKPKKAPTRRKTKASTTKPTTSGKKLPKK